jgi:hypothetical protein
MMLRLRLRQWLLQYRYRQEAMTGHGQAPARQFFSVMTQLAAFLTTLSSFLFLLKQFGGKRDIGL